MFNSKSLKAWASKKHQNCRLFASPDRLLTQYGKDVGYNNKCVTSITLNNNIAIITLGATVCTCPISNDLKALLEKISTKSSGFVSPKEIVSF